VTSNRAGTMSATTDRIIRLLSSPARSRPNRCRSRDQPPTRIARPRPSRLLPTMEPVIVAFTTPADPRARMKSARISSAALPKVTLSRPPIAEPAVAASCSVARRIQSARGTIARPASRKTRTGPAPSRGARTESGTSARGARRPIRRVSIGAPCRSLGGLGHLCSNGHHVCSGRAGRDRGSASARGVGDPPGRCSARPHVRSRLQHPRWCGVH
jgi:hypothetical protein